MKPNEDNEFRQDPGEIVFNGPHPVPPNGTSQCTRDFPCQAAHLFTEYPGLGVAHGCKANDWRLHRNSDGPFMSWGHDRAAAIGKDTCRLWVILNPKVDVGSLFAAPANNATIAAGDAIPMGSSTVSEGFNQVSRTVLRAEVDGLYNFGCQATLTSSNAPRGAQLRMTVRHQGRNTWAGYRTQNIEIDNYGFEVHTAAENVAISGLLNIKKNETLSIVNTGQYATTYSEFGFWIIKAAGYWQPLSRRQGGDGH